MKRNPRWVERNGLRQSLLEMRARHSQQAETEFASQPENTRAPSRSRQITGGAPGKSGGVSGKPGFREHPQRCIGSPKSYAIAFPRPFADCYAL